jgi:starch synthase (maltosyl-transferring)
MAPFAIGRDHDTYTLTTPEIALAFSGEHGGLQSLQRAGGPNVLGYGVACPAIDIHLDERGWLADQIFVRYLKHSVAEHDGAIDLVITIGVGPLIVEDSYRITGTFVARHLDIRNVGEDRVELRDVRLLLPWARVGALESCRFDAPGNSVRPHVALAVAAAQRRDVLPRRFFAPGLREGSALERAPTQGPGVMALHDPAIDEVLLCWYYSAAVPAQPQVHGNDLALTLMHEVHTADWLSSDQRIRVGTQYFLLLHEAWPAALSALERTWALCGFHALERPAEWMRDIAAYEVHPARFGGFAGLVAALPALRELGINTLCLLPIWAFANHKQRLWDGNWEASGNLYAIRDFEQIDPTLGDAGDLRALVAAAHQQQIRVLIDLPLEGCAADSPLVELHPAWFCRDQDRQIVQVPLQPDVVAFDWDQLDLQDSMIAWALGQVRAYDLDGYRILAPRELAPNWGRAQRLHAYDTSMGVLVMLERLQRELKLLKHDAVLLGALSGPIYDAVHDALVDELPHHMFVHLALSRLTPAELGEWLEDYDRALGRHVTRVCFTENHRTRIINPLADGLRGSRISRMLLAGLVMCGFAPLISAGQEEHDADFIRRLLGARAEHAALRYGRVAYNSLPCSNSQVFAVLRQHTGEHLIGLLNVSPHKHTLVLSLPVDRLDLPEGDYELLDLFTQNVWVEEEHRCWRRDELLALRLTLEPFAAYFLMVRAVVHSPDTGNLQAPIADPAPQSLAALPLGIALGEASLGLSNGRRQSRRKRGNGAA